MYTCVYSGCVGVQCGCARVYCMHHMFTRTHTQTIHSPEDYGDRSVDEGEDDWDLQAGQEEEEYSHSMHLCRTKPRMLRCDLIYVCVCVFVCVCGGGGGGIQPLDTPWPDGAAHAQV